MHLVLGLVKNEKSTKSGTVVDIISLHPSKVIVYSNIGIKLLSGLLIQEAEITLEAIGDYFSIDCCIIIVVWNVNVLYIAAHPRPCYPVACSFQEWPRQGEEF